MTDKTCIKFVVYGVPVGYKRTTQRAKFSVEYKRYQEYKSQIVAAFLDQVPGNWGYPKPLTTTKYQHAHISTKIFFADGRHGDPDNCLKAVLDALFKSDKYCHGDFSFGYDSENPRMEISLR